MTMLVRLVDDPEVTLYEAYCEESQENFERFKKAFAEVVYEDEYLIDCDEFIHALEKKTRWIIEVVRPTYDYTFTMEEIDVMLDEMEDRDIEENGD